MLKNDDNIQTGASANATQPENGSNSSEISPWANKKHHGVPFSPEMIRSLLAGRKFQTRRTRGLKYINERPAAWELLEFDGVTAKFRHRKEFALLNEPETASVKCPYGQIGDLIYAKETCWSHLGWESGVNDAVLEIGKNVHYVSDSEYVNSVDFPKGQYRQHPGILLPKKLARMWFLSTNIRIQRLHDITEADAAEEGVKFLVDPVHGYCSLDYLNGGHSLKTAKDSFRTLWKSINGNDSWHTNPWLWALSFSPIGPTEQLYAHRPWRTV